MSLLLLAVGDNGQPVATARLQVPLRLDDESYALMRQRGLLYSARLGIKEAGGYQIRAAVQDDRSKAIGTSAQFVEVPKVGKDHVALSGVVMMDVAAAGTAAPGETPRAAAMRTDVIADGVLGEPAIKIFKPGSEVAYTLRDLRRPRQAQGRVLDARHADPRRQGVLHHAAGARRRRAEGRHAGRRGPGRRQAVARPRPAARHLHAAGQRRAAVGQGPRSAGVAVGRLRGALMRTDSTLGIAATALALATCLLAPGVTARPGAQAPEAQAPGGQPTFRAGTRLATFDAVVTDARGVTSRT